jgi:hypothetical protein
MVPRGQRPESEIASELLDRAAADSTRVPACENAGSTSPQVEQNRAAIGTATPHRGQIGIGGRISHVGGRTSEASHPVEWTRISGALGHTPGWGGIYQVEATMNPKATDDEIRLMVRSLLQDRFKMTWHYETKQSDG